MTGRELIVWILEHKCEDAKIEVQYRDGGGDYNGTDEMISISRSCWPLGALPSSVTKNRSSYNMGRVGISTMATLTMRKISEAL